MRIIFRILFLITVVLILQVVFNIPEALAANIGRANPLAAGTHTEIVIVRYINK